MPNTQKRRVKLADLAEKTGFTIGTVSKALQSREGISDKTREIILKAAREIGYIANTQAGGLRSGQTKTVAIIVSDIANPLFSILIKNIIDQLDDCGYSAIVMDTEEKEQREEKAIISALQKNVDGIIICPTQQSMANIELLRQNGTPFVLIGRTFSQLDVDCVTWNDQHGGYVAARHLLERGHRDILVLAGSLYISSAHDRLAGYETALREAGLPLSPEMVYELNVASHDAIAAMERILHKGIRFTAILTFSDYIAWEVIYTLNLNGIRVPQDVAVVGFDNIQTQFHFPPPLTTVHVPKQVTARRAVELLVDIIQNRPIRRRQIQLNTRLVVRGTT